LYRARSYEQSVAGGASQPRCDQRGRLPRGATDGTLHAAIRMRTQHPDRRERAAPMDGARPHH